MDKLKKFLPPWREIFLVYSIVNFLVFSWAIFIFLYYLSGWILFLSLLDLLVVFSYGTLVVFIDIMLIMSLTLTLVILLPAKIMREKFVPVGGMFATIFFLWTVILQVGFEEIVELEQHQFILLVCTIVLSIFISLYAAHRVRFVATAVEGFSKRAGIFTALYAPWCFISLVVVIIRNML